MIYRLGERENSTGRKLHDSMKKLRKGEGYEKDNQTNYDNASGDDYVCQFTDNSIGRRYCCAE